MSYGFGFSFSYGFGLGLSFCLSFGFSSDPDGGCLDFSLGDFFGSDGGFGLSLEEGALGFSSESGGGKGDSSSPGGGIGLSFGCESMIVDSSPMTPSDGGGSCFSMLTVLVIFSTPS